ncbi:hypothetical protein RJJ65_09770 [Rhizobium hidalgonense]|uniref:Uncharacterized protein n=1 Tax=Rhizobium hidalgonense TaxID=1538159 RepID=A0AAJ2GTP8_9HYPH|nr:hypothetical protein [Rhizobium hidalgonense]MDR9772944.1 hypothetical protein [Rhizobium hidalgonense]
MVKATHFGLYPIKLANLSNASLDGGGSEQLITDLLRQSCQSQSFDIPREQCLVSPMLP